MTRFGNFNRRNTAVAAEASGGATIAPERDRRSPTHSGH
jgi:hypothetical protein